MLRAMSTETQEMDMSGTKPLPEHEWLRKLVGEWRVESEMTVPGGAVETGVGRERVTMFGDLWAFSDGEGTMPDGNMMQYKSGIGYDVSFKEYRGFWIANVSSHLWKYHCELSEDGRKMTMNCEGPNMFKDGETALYRDVIELIDDNRRTLTSFGQGDNGEWQQFMKATYTRI
jgi:hypothetical protein